MKLKVTNQAAYADSDHIWAYDINSGADVWLSYEQVETASALPTHKSLEERGLQAIWLPNNSVFGGTRLLVQNVDVEFIPGRDA